MRKLFSSILLALAAVGFAAERADHRTNESATAFPEWEKLSTPTVQITCKAAYYQRLGDKVLIPADEAQWIRDLQVSGVVLSIVEPDQFKGQVVAFHFDFPENWDHWYQPGLLYQGQIRTGYIGKLAFICDPGFLPTRLTQPLPSASPEALRPLLRNRVWGAQYAAAIKEQFGDATLFVALYGFLTDTNRSSTRCADQQTAARLLVRFQPACNISLHKAIGETLLTWDQFVGEWPLYLWRSFGREELLHTLAQLEGGKLSETEREAIEAWRYWLSGDQKDLTGRP